MHVSCECKYGNTFHCNWFMIDQIWLLDKFVVSINLNIIISILTNYLTFTVIVEFCVYCCLLIIMHDKTYKNIEAKMTQRPLRIFRYQSVVHDLRVRDWGESSFLLFILRCKHHYITQTKIVPSTFICYIPNCTTPRKLVVYAPMGAQRAESRIVQHLVSLLCTRLWELNVQNLVL